MNLWELAQISMEADTPWAKVYKKGTQVQIPNQLIVSYANRLRETISKENQNNKSISDISID